MNQSHLVNSFDDLDKAGEFAELLDLANSQLDSLDGKYWKIHALWKLGRISEALSTASSYEKEFESSIMQSRFFLRYGTIYWSMGDLASSLEYTTKAMQSAKEANNLDDWANSLHNLGTLYSNRGDLENALIYFEEALGIDEQIGDRMGIAYCLYNIGVIYRLTGRLDEALEFYKKSLCEMQDQGNPGGIASNLSAMGLVYRQKGDLGQAYDNFEESLQIYQKLGNPRYEAIALNNIGEIYLATGDPEEAQGYFEESLSLRLMIDNPLELVETYEALVRTHIGMGDDELVTKYVDEMKQLQDETENKVIDLFTKFSQALQLKSHKRQYYKTQAQQLLEDIVQNYDFQFEIHSKAIYHLLELLILEYRNFEEEEVYEEIINYSTKLHKHAEDQNMWITLVNSLLIKSQLALVENKFDEASTILQQAQMICEEKKLPQLLDYVRSERSILHETITELKSVLNSTSISQKVNQLQLIEYIKKVRQFELV